MEKTAGLALQGLGELRRSRPMIHHITNDVVNNFTANVTLCLGAAPVMAPDIGESAEMAAAAGCLLLNIGTVSPRQLDSMIAAGRRANELGIPVVLDPVGAGATVLRTSAVESLLGCLSISIIRGNAGEVLNCAGAGGRVRGVDSMETGRADRSVFDALALRLGGVVAVTGAVDYVTDGCESLEVPYGHPLMGMVTGTGCGATTAVACFAALGGSMLERCAGALAAYGAAGQTAAARAGGPGTFVPLFLDALASLGPEDFGA
jgi:hydroxyethylthiazole kinase